MHRFAPSLIAAAALSFAAFPASASIPGNVDERSFEGLLHVCTDSEPGAADYVICEEQEFGDSTAPYTGEECVAAGQPAFCTIDFLPNVAITGKLTLLADGDGPRTALLFEFGLAGQRFVVADIFDTDRLGNWNPLFGDELQVLGNFSVQDSSITEFQYASGNLLDVSDKIRTIVEDARGIDLTGAIPVFVRATFKDSAPSADGSQDPTASAGVHLVTLRFARLRP